MWGNCKLPGHKCPEGGANLLTVSKTEAYGSEAANHLEELVIFALYSFSLVENSFSDFSLILS
jgi:hypothetical protein